MSIDGRFEKLPAHVLHEAARLFFEIRDELHVVEANGNGVLFALITNPQLADRMATCGVASEDDEDDGTAEDDGRLLPNMIETLLTPAPRQGYDVPSWSPSAISNAAAVVDADERGAPADVAQLWPNLVRRQPTDEA